MDKTGTSDCKSLRIQHLLTTTALSINSSLSSSCIPMCIISFQMHLVLLILVRKPNVKSHYEFSHSIHMKTYSLLTIYLSCFLSALKEVVEHKRRHQSNPAFKQVNIFIILLWFISKQTYVNRTSRYYLKLRESIFNVPSVIINWIKRKKAIKYQMQICGLEAQGKCNSNLLLRPSFCWRYDQFTLAVNSILFLHET